MRKARTSGRRSPLALLQPHFDGFIKPESPPSAIQPVAPTSSNSDISTSTSTSPNMQACDSCHRRKSRCDKVKPTCGFCEKANVQCTYSDRTKDPSIRKDHVEAVERRLRHAEAKNKALASELANLRSAAASRSRGDSLTPGDGPQVRIFQVACPKTPRHVIYITFLLLPMPYV
jgi:hypothetical protein